MAKSGLKLTDAVEELFAERGLETDQLRHRDHLQPMLFAELMELRHPGHGAVVIHDFADDSGRMKPGET